MGLLGVEGGSVCAEGVSVVAPIRDDQCATGAVVMCAMFINNAPNDLICVGFL